MKSINAIPIEDTFAEAFGMKATRILITAIDAHWARVAAKTMTGFATSVIGCGVEAGIEAACAGGPRNDVLGNSAGNYGGKLGQLLFRLHEFAA